jgi:Transglycosylase SLT domain
MAVGDYDEAIRRRLALIETIGQDATRQARAAADRRSQAQDAALTAQLGASSGQPRQQSFNWDVGGSTGNASLDRFINAIAGQESGGSYGAVNRSSGALGKYQIMPGNVPGWSQQVLGQRISPQQFLQNPSLQEKVARGQLANYYNRYGPAGAAVAWYAGEGNARKYVANPSGWNRRQGNYPSVSQYVASIMRRMGL